jgi:hypothetical protein
MISPDSGLDGYDVYGPFSSLAKSHAAGQCLHAPPQRTLQWSVRWELG